MVLRKQELQAFMREVLTQDIMQKMDTMEGALISQMTLPSHISMSKSVPNITT